MQSHARKLLSELPEGIGTNPFGKSDDNRRDEPPTVAKSNRPTITAESEKRLFAASVLAQLDEIDRKLATTRGLFDGAFGVGPGPTEPAYPTVEADIPRWHFPMLNDIERNDAFAVALERLVPAGSHVLDIGAGSGLLAMLAVQAGAGRVTACEANPLVAEIARQVVEAHGLADVVTIVPKRSTELRIGRDLPAPVDLIVSETVDCGLIGEGLLATMRHARAELLRPGGRLVPESGRLFGALLESRMVARLNRVDTVAGFDLRLFNRVATRGHFPLRLATWPHRLLSEATGLVDFDLHRDPLDDGERTVLFTGTEPGEAHGLVAWFELRLGAGVALHNTPDNLGLHWMQAFVPFDEPVSVDPEQPLAVTLRWHRSRLTVSRITVSTSKEAGQ